VQLANEDEDTMRNLIALVILGIACAAYSQSSQQPFTITISTEKPELKVGDHVYLKVVMKNTSDHDISCDSYWYDTLDRNYIYDVVFEDGKPAQKIQRKTPSSSHPCIISPTESKASGGVISRAYDFSRPGKYTIQVSRPVWDDDQRPGKAGNVQNNQAEVKSNSITITVVGPEAPAAGPR
jgi:hypothetical protein